MFPEVVDSIGGEDIIDTASGRDDNSAIEPLVKGGIVPAEVSLTLSSDAVVPWNAVCQASNVVEAECTYEYSVALAGSLLLSSINPLVVGPAPSAPGPCENGVKFAVAIEL